MDDKWVPDGFILSEAAIYAFKCQDVYPDIISFAAAIPDNLKPLFLIPIKLEPVTAATEIASRISSTRCAEGALPTGDTDESELWGTKTFVYDDNEPTVPPSEEGSIFRMDDADDLTHHQENNYDENIQVPTDTTFMEDIDITQYQKYPYRTDEAPIRHSSVNVNPVVIIKLALKPDVVAPHTPEKIQNNARSCVVALVSYDKNTRIYTFSVDAGHGAKTVQASLSDIDDVALSCNCPFWRYNGPEFNAKTNRFMLGQPYGTASPPNVRDPERQYWLCKHAYAVLKRLDHFVQEVIDENWELDDKELLSKIDEEWDRVEGAVEVPIEEAEADDIDIDFEEEPEEIEPEEIEVEPEETPVVPEPAEGPPLDEGEEQVYDYDEVPIYVEGPEGEDVPFDYDAEEPEEEPIEEYDEPEEEQQKRK
jgi:hypothetical protein